MEGLLDLAAVEIPRDLPASLSSLKPQHMYSKAQQEARPVISGVGITSL